VRTIATPADRAALRIVEAWVKVHGWAPSYRQLLTLFGVRSVTTVAWRLRRLETLGWIERSPGQPRALRVTGNDGGGRDGQLDG